MSWTTKSLWVSGLSLSLFAFGAQAQDEPTMVILPEEAADQADVTQDIVLPDEAAEGIATAEANRGAGDANAADGAAEAQANAADGLAEAQANAAEAAQQGLQTAMDAVEGAREELGRANIPQDLPAEVPTDLPAVPGDTLPEDVDLPTPPVPATPAGG